MSRRIDIELTSAQPDGRWTWRAAGARQPKGVVEGEVLYDGAKAGDVVRAEAEFEIDGITIVSVFPPKEKRRHDEERIELLGPSEPAVGQVTTQLVGRSERRGDRRDGDRRERRDRREGAGGRDGGRSEGRNGPRSSGPRGGGPRSSGPLERTAGDNETPSDGEGSDVATPGAGSRGRDRARPSGERGARGPGNQGGRGPGSDGGDRQGRKDGGEGRTSPDRRSRRLNPSNVHRQEVLDSLPAEQRAVAEQLLRGGIPAVRTAISLEREKAVAEGRPAPNAEQLLLLAESLLPRLKTAEWRDRAEAAAKSPGDVSLRDLRSIVAGADAARDDETRALASTLREALDARINTLRTTWIEEIEHHLAENRIVRGLRLSGRPPEPSARLSAEISERLATAASVALNPETTGERWVALLEAVAESPVRRLVKPAGLPTDASPEVLRVAHTQAGRVPALAGLLGIAIPPPPGPRRPGGSSPRPPRRPPAGRLPAGEAQALQAEIVETGSAAVEEPVEAHAALVESGAEAVGAAVAEPEAAATEPEPAADDRFGEPSESEGAVERTGAEAGGTPDAASPDEAHEDGAADERPAAADPASADPAGADPASADPAGADPAGADSADADEIEVGSSS